LSGRLATATAFLVALFLGASATGAMDAVGPDRVVAEALAKAHDPGDQAEALVALAWPPQGGDAQVRAEARRVLAELGQGGMPALRKAVRTVKPAEQVEVVETLLLEFRQLTGGLPPDYLPALEEAIWFGTRDARRIAIAEVSRFDIPVPVLTIIDAAIEDPEILPISLDALGAMGDPRARFFLERTLYEGKSGVREKAAVALARLGRPGRAVLKKACGSEKKEIRLASIRALLPVAAVEDLSSLYDYTASHASDDPATANAVDAAANRLEKALEAQQAADSASPAPR
jgi:hypothetical protein